MKQKCASLVKAIAFILKRVNAKVRTKRLSTCHILVGLALILMLLFHDELCFANQNKIAGSSTSVTNISEYISYESTYRLHRQPVSFERLEKVEENTKKIIQPSTKDIIGSELDLKAEKALIASQKGLVIRAGKTLIIKSQSGKSFIFKNYYRPSGKDHEGDSERYVYSGLLDSTGYHKVGVIYMHDSFGTYFINPHTDAIIYASTGDHVGYLSNNRILLINNSLNQPFGIVIANITKTKNIVELQCISHISSDPKRSGEFEGWDNKLLSQFKGWQIEPDVGFDLVVSLPITGAALKVVKETIPMRFNFVSGKWHIYVQERHMKTLSTRLSCWQ